MTKPEYMTIPIDLIDPHPENPRQHPDEQLVGLEKSYEHLGQFRTFVVWQRPNGRYTQVTSHGITEAMRREGATYVRVEALPEDTDPLTIKQIMLADNLHAQKASDDSQLLSQLLQEQQDAGYDLALLGSDEEMLRQMLNDIRREHATDFLKPILSPGLEEDDESMEEENEGVPSSDTNGTYFAVSYALTAEQRATVLAALKKAKQRWNLQTSNQALVQICTEFLEEDS